MAQHIFLCTKCYAYTMEEICRECGSKTIFPKPPKYSPDDKYADLKRKAKREFYKKKGYT